MVQLKVLSGKMAGTEVVARRFPFRVGRGAGTDLRMEEEGVWESHAELAFEAATGFVLTAGAEALTGVNGEPVRRAVLKNGDCIELGAVKIRFWLAETRQAGVWWRDWLAWAGIAAMTAGQVWVIYELGR